MSPRHWVRCAALIAGRDLQVQWRTQVRVQGLAAFAATILLLFSFAAGPNVRQVTPLAAGFIWLAILLSSTLSLGESMRQELEGDGLSGTLLAGVPPSAVFAGKGLANAVLLWALGLMLTPVAIALFAVDKLPGDWLIKVPWVLACGSLAFSAPGTLVAALSARARGRETLLPLLLLPLLLPAMLASVRALGGAFDGDPMRQWHSWMRLLCAFNAVYWPLCTVLFGHVLEDR